MQKTMPKFVIPIWILPVQIAIKHFVVLVGKSNVTDIPFVADNVLALEDESVILTILNIILNRTFHKTFFN